MTVLCVGGGGGELTCKIVDSIPFQESERS